MAVCIQDRKAGASRNTATRLLRDVYDTRAQVYKELWAPLLEAASRRMIAALAADRQDPTVREVLDIGTGIGTLLPWLERAFPGAVITGIDQSTGMLALASPRYRRILMDARELDFPAGCMDLVTAAFMLFYLTPPVAGVHEARRVLRRGGRFASITWGKRLPETKADQVWRQCLDQVGADTPAASFPYAGDQLDTPWKVHWILLAGGLRDVRAWEDTVEHRLDREGFLRLRTAIGPEIGRFRSLDAERQQACVAEARHRLRELDEKSFTLRARAVYGIGRA